MALALVGSGSGDPLLLTVRASALLAAAEEIVCDADAGPRLLERVTAPGERVVVASAEAAEPVVARLVVLARARRSVVRLYDGEPVSSARALAEARLLAAAGVDFELVPGVSAAGPTPDLARWRELLPLSGLRVMVTRTREQAPELVRAVEGRGGRAVEFPTIRIEEPADAEALVSALQRVGEYDWIVFTSVNGVGRFFDVLRSIGRDTRSLGRARVAAIGPATAAALERHGVRADLVPERFVSESIADRLDEKGVDLRGARVLLPRADLARAALPELLRERGALVDEVTAYRIVPDSDAADEARAALDAGEVDFVTFTAGSTVRYFVDAVGADVGRARVASIGPITSAALRELGMPVDVEATEHTTDGLVRALGHAARSDRS
ncbi:MAG TPA: uroporphyrinogen-III synthase [Longimicrobiaceae bacterium]|nr:uroporphyrinogen-III synthase [Longimicrobiaceae bacterium]